MSAENSPSAVVAKVVGATSSEAVGAFLVYCMMSVNVPDTNLNHVHFSISRSFETQIKRYAMAAVRLQIHF